MARRCGCASDSCSCTVIGGEGIEVVGTGSEKNPFVVTSTVADIETGIDVQYNNTPVINDVHRLDFRGATVTVTPGVDEAIVNIVVPDPVSGTTIPPGMMMMFGGGAAPTGWLLCNGQTVLIADQANLFAAIGTTYGGDGVANFKVPNLVNKFPIGASGIRPQNELGGGDFTVTIGTTNLPPHGHGMTHTHATPNHTHPGLIHGTDAVVWVQNAYADGNKAGIYSSGSPNTPMVAASGGGGLSTGGSTKATTDLTGGGADLTVVPEYIAVNYLIKT